MLRTSLWTGTQASQSFPTLNEDLSVDIAIVGAGITGITAALALCKAGKKVAVLEARKIGSGSTADSTGNLYALTDHHLYTIEQRWNHNTMLQVASSRNFAVSMIESNITELKIDCSFDRCPFYLYSADENTEAMDSIEKEHSAALAAGLPSTLTKSFPWHHSVARAIIVENQAQFHPSRYVRGIASALQSDNCLIFENSPVTDISGSKREVSCNGYKVKAEKIVMATHTPKGFNILQAEMVCNREYGIAARINPDSIKSGIFWDIGSSSKRSIRAYNDGIGTYLVAVGEKHKVGHFTDTAVCFDNLEAYVRSHFSVEKVDYRWSGQHYVPADGLPYIGVSTMSDHVYIATGFSTDGLVYGTLAGHLISEQIIGIENPWHALYNARRFTPLKSSKQFLEMNVDVMKSYFEDYVLHKNVEPLNSVLNGQGSLVEVEGKKLAAYRDDHGQLTVLSPICPHMKCQVHWNSGEKSWDCPCHGSRFDLEGKVIEGPALCGLEKADIVEE